MAQYAYDLRSGGVAMSHQLQMHTEVESWLNGLRTRDPAAARSVGEAVTALLDEGSGLRSPLVVTVDLVKWAPNPAAALDHSYRRHRELVQKVRRSVADIATSRKRLEFQIEMLESQARKLEDQSLKATEAGRDDLARVAQARRSAVQDQLVDLRRLHADQQRQAEESALAAQRLKAKVEAFGVRKETAKATYATGQAQATIQEALAATEEENSGTGEPTPQAEAAFAAALAAFAGAESAAETLQDGIHVLENEAEQWRVELRFDLKELRLAALTGHDVRILFVIQRPGTVVLLTARDGHGGWWDWYDETFWRPSAENPTAAETDDVSYTKGSFLDTFFPGQASELTAGAAHLVARNRVHPLTEARRRAGLTKAQVAERMNVGRKRVSAIERAEPGATEIGTLAAYVQALGGRLEIIADLGAERLILG